MYDSVVGPLDASYGTSHVAVTFFYKLVVVVRGIVGIHPGSKYLQHFEY